MRSIEQIIQDLKKNINNGPKQYPIVELLSNRLNIPPRICKRGIKQGNLKINGKIIYDENIKVDKNLNIFFSSMPIVIKEDNQESFLQIIIREFIKEVGIKELNKIPTSERRILSSYFIDLLSSNQYDSKTLHDSEEFTKLLNELEKYYKDFHGNLNIRIPKRKELIDFFIKLKNEQYILMLNLIQDLCGGLYDENLYKFLQYYKKIYSNRAFQFIVEPNLNNSIISPMAIESLIKPIKEVSTVSDIDIKYQIYENHSPKYSNYLSLIKEPNYIYTNVFKPLVNKLHLLLQLKCETLENKTATIEILNIDKRYNFKINDRNDFNIYIRLKNSGDGLARNIEIESSTKYFQFDKITIGSLKPGESMEYTIKALIDRNNNFLPELFLKYSWRDTSYNIINSSVKIILEEQSEQIPWEYLEKIKPYTIQEIQEPNKLYGRDSILNELKDNILSVKIESYRIWGQKRVGKSSIVKTLKSLFNDNSNIFVIWRSIAELRNSNPLQTLNDLGESLCSEILDEIETKIDSNSIRETLKSVQVPSFNGSLFPLDKYIKRLIGFEKNLKIVFILDEFDRLNEDFFLPGDLGDTLSLNIGKGINNNNNVGFILVGSENMHLLDRHGMNYNNYVEREIDTFDKSTQYESFKNIIKGPVDPYLKYSEEAIECIYNFSNGNPYFANLICSHIFRIALENRDYEIDVNTVNNALDIIVKSSQKTHFEHFWSDGISDETSAKREKKIDIRRRVLISFSYYKTKTGEYPNRKQILDNLNKPLEYILEQYEIENTIKEFISRRIFYETEFGKITIKPTLFEHWLCGPGRNLMIEGISDLEAYQLEEEREAEYSLKDEEIKRIRDNYKFKGESISNKTIEKYFEQFGGHIHQRRIFKLIDSIYYISKYELIDFIKKEQKYIFQKKEIIIDEKTRIVKREGVVIYSFTEIIDEYKESFDLFKNLSRIDLKIPVLDLNNLELHNNNVDTILIIIPIFIEKKEFDYLLNKLIYFDNNKLINVRIISFIISSKIRIESIKHFSIKDNIKLIYYKEVDEKMLKPLTQGQKVFETDEEANNVYSEIKRHFPIVGKECLNVVFETVCPGKSIPVLWAKTNNFLPLFLNEYGKIDNVENGEIDGELRRERIFRANVILSRKLNSFIFEFIRREAKSNGDNDIFLQKYIPTSVLTKMNEKYHADKEKDSKETYIDFLEYGDIIKKHQYLTKILSIVTKDLGNIQLKWIEKLNELRRDPAHVEKPPPTEDEVNYFETIKDLLMSRMI